MRVIGLTGGIGTGKSTVAGILAHELHVPIIDADLVAREVVEPGSPVLRAIAQAFGADVLQADGRLDRARLRALIAADAEARVRLNGLTHPAILGRIAERLREMSAQGHLFAVVEAALMIETGSYRSYDALIVVSCTVEHQRERVMARDAQSAAAATALISTQLPLADKEALADYVIRNDGDLEALRQRTHEVWHAIAARSEPA